MIYKIMKGKKWSVFDELLVCVMHKTVAVLVDIAQWKRETNRGIYAGYYRCQNKDTEPNDLIKLAKEEFQQESKLSKYDKYIGYSLKLSHRE